ncbi:Flp family type IVb pilin [Vibrio diazotrophicus]|uniref:Flp family type IVb pilin n=1 Tax=Vibrio diazotrophicus TaxID=685 RepID=UPI0022B01E92|nr:Flp family type IVb pilin [Vibrio diazotrophicus]MCZ4373007.1 Flp family type IVb pilin [Vibrio diazotrophicus]
MNKFIEQAKAFWQDEDGLSAVEYVVAGALVIAVLVGGFTTLGTTLSGKLESLNTSITGGTAGGDTGGDTGGTTP